MIFLFSFMCLLSVQFSIVSKYLCHLVLCESRGKKFICNVWGNMILKIIAGYFYAERFINSRMERSSTNLYFSSFSKKSAMSLFCDVHSSIPRVHFIKTHVTQTFVLKLHASTQIHFKQIHVIRIYVSQTDTC